MNLKKIIAGLLALIMVLALAGCGAADDASAQPEDDAAAAAAEVEETAEDEAAPEIEETPEPEDASEDEDVPEDETATEDEEAAEDEDATEDEDVPAVEEAPEEEDAGDAWAAEVADLDRLGEETKDSVLVKLVNATGTNITGLYIKTSDDWEYSANLVADGDVFETEEEAVLCYVPAGEDTTYDIQVNWSDGTGWYLHKVALSDIQTAEIQRADNSLPYLTYESVSTGEAVDTYDAELEEYLATETAPAQQSNSGGGYSYSAGGTSTNDESCLDDALFW